MSAYRTAGATGVPTIAMLTRADAEAAAGTPTRRITAAGEVAEMAAYLLSTAAGNVTGQAIALDGCAGL